MEITESAGYKKLLAAVERDESGISKGMHNYRAKLAWVLDRAKHYAEKTGLDAASVLDAWESARDYWYMNYYQDCNQPEIKGDSVRVFDTQEALLASVDGKGFRCPCCGGISKSPYTCDSGLPMPGEKKTCDWKSWGLFGTLGKGVSVFVKDKMRGESFFKPVAWEEVATVG